MKKSVALFLICFFIATLVACGKPKATLPEPEPIPEKVSQVELEKEPESEEESEEELEEESEEKSEEESEELPPPPKDEEFKKLLREKRVYLTLVNKTNLLPEKWGYVVVIDKTKNSLGEEIQIEHETLENFLALQEDLLKNEGIQIELDSVYRSVEEQQEIWDAWAADPDKGIGYCEKYLSPPGYSEHHTGLAVDIFIIKDGKVIRENDDLFADKEDFKIIHKYLNEHGFILRYQEGKEGKTGYAYEPWHFRYVGSPTIAKKIARSGLSLEEWLEKNKF